MIYRVIKEILKNKSYFKKEFVKEIQKRTGLQYRTINEHLYYLELEGRITQINEKYALSKPQRKIKSVPT